MSDGDEQDSVAASGERSVTPPSWSPWMALAAPALGFGATAVLAAIVFAVVGATPGPDGKIDVTPGLAIVSLIVQNICLVGAVLLLAAITDRPRPWQFGWRRPRNVRRAVGLTIACWLAFVLFSSLWLLIIGRTGDRDTIADELGAETSLLAGAVVALLLAVAAPIVEELLFRGFVFGSLRTRLGLWPAASITGLMFGFAHVIGSPVAFLLPLAIFGMLLCLLYHYTGSIYPAMAAHCINNAIAYGSGMGGAWVPFVLFGGLTSLALTVYAVRAIAGPVPVGAPSP